MSLGQFQIGEQQRFAVANARAFRAGRGRGWHADGAGIRRLGPETFARLDKNRDGVLTADEMHPRNLARADRSQKRRYD